MSNSAGVWLIDVPEYSGDVIPKILFKKLSLSKSIWSRKS